MGSRGTTARRHPELRRDTKAKCRNAKKAKLPSILVIFCWIGACSREEHKPGAPKAATEVNPRPVAQLVFPNTLEAEDASVNAFVRQAMNTCASRDYDAFRLLWSAREDPMSREEFEESWNAVRDIRVRALERARVAAGDSAASGRESANPNRAASEPQLVYVIHAEVALDPAHPAAQRSPEREVVLMLVREHDRWRLARAPKPMRAWIRKKAEESGPARLVDQPVQRQP